jgi:hypothetical protein
MNREVATPNMYNIYYTKNFTMGPFYICSRQLNFMVKNTTVTRKGSSIGTEPNYYYSCDLAEQKMLQIF